MGSEKARAALAFYADRRLQPSGIQSLVLNLLISMK